jgi:hypothetical protein
MSSCLSVGTCLIILAAIRRIIILQSGWNITPNSSSDGSGIGSGNYHNGKSIVFHLSIVNGNITATSLHSGSGIVTYGGVNNWSPLIQTLSIMGRRITANGISVRTVPLPSFPLQWFLQFLIAIPSSQEALIQTSDDGAAILASLQQGQGRTGIPTSWTMNHFLSSLHPGSVFTPGNGRDEQTRACTARPQLP